MNQRARLALATSEMGTKPSNAVLAWLAGLTDLEIHVQHFRSRACPVGAELVSSLAGLPSRHLDAWLMPDDVLRSLFHRGVKTADLAIVEGTFGEAAPTDCRLGHPSGGLAPIVEALDLPVVAVIPAPDPSSCHLPRIPEEASAIFLENLENPNDFEMVRRMIGLVTKKPVLGAVERFKELDGLPDGGPIDLKRIESLFLKLSNSFLRFADIRAIRQLAASRPYSWTPPEPIAPLSRPFRVAYAQDSAFGGYFPDTLEVLEILGADLVPFSPIQNEHLPADIDLVMIGCGFPERFLDRLAGNLSMIAELRSHVCSGKRIYAEGGGAAYLGRYMLINGHRVPSAGILPFDAELLDLPPCPKPVVRVLQTDTWIGPAGTEVRGYDSGRWRFHPESTDLGCCGSFGALTEDEDIYYRHHAVGGLIHLHLGALPQVVASFVGEHPASLSLRASRPAQSSQNRRQ